MSQIFHAAVMYCTVGKCANFPATLKACPNCGNDDPSTLRQVTEGDRPWIQCRDGRVLGPFSTENQAKEVLGP